MSITSLLTDLAGAPESFPVAKLQALSNVYPDELAEFDDLFPTLPENERRLVATWLTDLAEDNVALNFDSIFAVMLGDEDAEVRLRAIESLWESDDSALIDRFLDLLANDPSAAVRAAAAQALGAFELAAELDDRYANKVDEMDAALLTAFDNEDEVPLVRRRALESVAVRSLDAIPAAIRTASLDRQVDLRLGAIRAMGRTADDRWLGAILSELMSDDVEFRFEAVTALGEMETESAVPAILPLLEDEDAQVRFAVIDSLGKISGTTALDALRQLARAEDDAIREAADEALAEASLEDPLV